MATVLIRRFAVGVATAVLTGSAALAADTVFTLRSELSGTDFDWSKKESYVNAEVDPVAGDVVNVPAAFTNKLTYGTANWAFLSQLQAVIMSPDAELTLEVQDGVAELQVPITTAYEGYSSNFSSAIRKIGDGELYLSSFRHYYQQAYRDYYTGLKVEAGTLRLTENCTVHNAECYFGPIEIAEGATLYTVNGNRETTVQSRTYTPSLNGSGFIKNDSTDKVQYFYVQNNTVGSHSVFAGQLMGAKLQVYVVFTRLDFTNPDNATFGAVIMDGGAVHGWTYPDSTRGWNTVGQSYGGTWKYLGTEPCTFAGSAYITAGYNCFDGGEFGGVTFGAGGNQQWSVHTPGRQTMVELKGSNTVNECVIDLWLNIPYAYIRKSEPGIWRFTANYESTRRNSYSNGLAVAEGTVRFDSIAEAGTVCSLGMGNWLTEEPYKWGSTVALKEVDYAFKLGSFDAEGNPVAGTLELTGTTTADQGFVCHTRPIALASTGVLKVPDVHADANAAIGTALQFGGVSALDAGEKKLVLDGDNPYDNVISNITDGAGTVSLEKRGNGQWTVRGDLSIHGDLDVQAGTLILENTELGAHYTRYRFYMKETAYGAYQRDPEGYYIGLDKDEGFKSGGRQPQVQRLYLYDADGNVVTKNLSTNSYAYMLEPNRCTSVGPNRCAVYSKTDFTLKGLFECSSDDKFSCEFAKQLEVDKPETWGCVEFMLPEGAPEVVGYDVFQNRKLDYSYSTRILTAWELHGSADGRNWHKLHGVEDFEASKEMTTWCCDKSWNAGIYGTKRDLTAHPIYTFTDGEFTDGDGFTQLDHIRSVSVAKGAKLIAKGVTPEAISSLKIADSGMGELKNVALAVEGTVDLQLSTPNAVAEIETSLSELATGVNVTEWTLKVNGQPRRSATLELDANGKLIYRPAGTVLIVK